MIATTSQESPPAPTLTKRWTKLKYHPEQRRLWDSEARFRVVPAGRRSGKTEFAKRNIATKAMEFCTFPDGWFICAAPVFAQAREIYWADLKALVPDSYKAKVSESLLDIHLINGARLSVRGLDRPERIEGPPIDGIVLDEYGNMKASSWEEHIRPALGTVGRPGWAWLIGVPEGRNHYYRLAQKAKANKTGAWDFFTWFSADIIDAEELEEMKGSMDPRTFAQECEGAFEDFEGRAYYGFDRKRHAMLGLDYMPNRDLIICFDFNVSPGVAVVLQEQPFKGKLPGGGKTDAIITAVIGEVHIPRNSNTPAVCNSLVAAWGDHRGRVLAYGDATGGAKGTAQTEGTDWELIDTIMTREFGSKFSMEVPKGNPREKARLNSLNSRIESADNVVSLLVDPDKAPHLVEDLEGVRLSDDPKHNGEIDKKSDSTLTHLSDALGYYCNQEHPVGGGAGITVQDLGRSIRR